MRDLDQYLQQRGQRWHYVRRVPSEFQHIDRRGTIRKSLKTDSLEVARKRRDDLVLADDEYWKSLTSIDSAEGPLNSASDKFKAEWQKYQKAKEVAISMGFVYRPIHEIAEGQTQDILDRISALEASKGQRNIPSKDDADALLGTVPRPKVPISQAFEIYCGKIAASELITKSEAQKRAWRKVKVRAVNNFISICGDIPMSEITREHARSFHDWWAKRIMPDDPAIAPLSANSGNRDMGNLSKLYRTYWEYEGDETRLNPFRKLRFKDEGGKDVKHFSDEWVRTKILKPGVFDGLNREATLLVYGLIETGCRPSELANIMPENIRLNAEFPHIRIRSTPQRQLKSVASKREIPLVGISLLAFQQAPNGFPHYRDKTELLSASLMKAFRARGLLPTPNHRIYSEVLPNNWTVLV